tara:strand:- start:322 stop:894 length:573 start_codon:yes stop_codon:yes gene_type:complete
MKIGYPDTKNKKGGHSSSPFSYANLEKKEEKKVEPKKKVTYSQAYEKAKKNDPGRYGKMNLAEYTAEAKRQKAHYAKTGKWDYKGEHKASSSKTNTSNNKTDLKKSKTNLQKSDDAVKKAKNNNVVQETIQAGKNTRKAERKQKRAEKITARKQKRADAIKKRGGTRVGAGIRKGIKKVAGLLKKKKDKE